ncbi:MAG: glutamate racemase [Paludibacteraceae bacterium]|nr:glutamate racemase [Paludibacteraceae bacterium]
MRIGVFDSGYGGLTILKALHSELPDYDFVYLGDNARAPYGTRSFDVVYEYTLEAVKCLMERGCDLVVLACNTASAKALRSIQQNDLPQLGSEKRVLGVVRPTVEVIGQYTKSRKVGILATEGTVASRSYSIEIGKLAPDVEVYEQACPMWVPLIENNERDNEGADYFIRKYTSELMSRCADIDTVVLGCTHYPIIKRRIEECLPPTVRVVEQGGIVARSLKDYLRRHGEMDARCARNGQMEFLTTESEEKFRKAAADFVGIEIKQIKAISL